MSPRTSEQADRQPLHASQRIVLVLAVGYLLAGLAGFVVTGFGDFARESDDSLLGFGVNPLHNLVHLALGIAGVAAHRTMPSAKAYAWALVVGSALLVLFGLMAVRNADLNFLNIDNPDMLLHAGSLLGGFAAGVWPAHRFEAAGHRTRHV